MEEKPELLRKPLKLFSNIMKSSTWCGMQKLIVKNFNHKVAVFYNTILV